MALGTTDITTTLVRNELSEDNNAVFELCTSAQINKWSLHKPHRTQTAGSAYYEGTGSVKTHGLYRLISDGLVYYLTPDNSGNNPARLGDFREYNHSALPNGRIWEINSVYEVDTDTYLSAPYSLIRGLQYTINFSISAGVIDPETIALFTVNAKKISTNLGFGGVMITSGIASDTLVTSADVFSIPANNIDVTFICQNSTYAFDIYYCSHPESTEYWVTPFTIENDGYKTQFPAIAIALSVGSQDVHITGNDPNTIFTHATITSTMSRNFSVARVNYHYRTNGKSFQDVYKYNVNMVANTTTAISYNPLPFNDLDEGDNLIFVQINLQVYRDGVYTTVATGGYSETIHVHLN